MADHNNYDDYRPLIEWRAVIGGAVWGFATMLLLTSLWVALATASNMTTIRENLDWYIGASAIFAMFLGGYLAGLFSGLRGLLPGIVNGTSVWSLTLVASLLIGAGAAAPLLDRLGTTTGNIPQATTGGGDVAWTVFWSLLIGLGAAMLGGILGGITPRMGRTTTERREVHRHDDRYEGRDERFDDDRDVLDEDVRRRRAAS